MIKIHTAKNARQIEKNYDCFCTVHRPKYERLVFEGLMVKLWLLHHKKQSSLLGNAVHFTITNWHHKDMYKPQNHSNCPMSLDLIDIPQSIEYLHLSKCNYHILDVIVQITDTTLHKWNQVSEPNKCYKKSTKGLSYKCCVNKNCYTQEIEYHS